MLDTLITSRTRIKLLLKFFLNSKAEGYLRNLEQEFNESSNSIRIELNRLEDAGLLQSRVQQNKKLYSANTSHPLFPDIHNIIKKYIGFDKIIEDVVEKIGLLSEVYVLGDFAIGKDSNQIDLAFVGDSINLEYLEKLVHKVEKLIKRNIKYLVLTNNQRRDFFLNLPNENYFLVWEE